MVDPRSNKQLIHLSKNHVNTFNGRTGDVISVGDDTLWDDIDFTGSDIADIITKSHTSLTDIGSNTHVDIDNHITDVNKHLDWTQDLGATNIHYNNNTLFGTVNQGVVAGSGGGTVNYLRADGSWESPPPLAHAMDSATYHTSSDVATLNATTAKHGFLKKLPDEATQYMNGVGNWTVPASTISISGTPADNQIAVWTNATTIEGNANLTFDGFNMKFGNGSTIYIQTGQLDADEVYFGAWNNSTYTYFLQLTADTAGSPFINYAYSANVFMTALGSNDSEDHVIAIDDSTGLLTKRAVSTIGQDVAIGNTGQIPYSNTGTPGTDFNYSSNLIFDGTNLGIGTNNPYNNLEVVGIIKGHGEYGGIVVDDQYDVNRRIGLIKYPGYEGALVAGSSSKLRLGHRTDSNDIVTTLGTFREELVIDTTGYVGIGTPSPRALLDISTGFLVGTGLELPHVVKKVASANLRNSHNAEASTDSTSYVKLKTITLTNGLVGQHRIKFDMRATSDSYIVYGRIYRNGVALGTEQSTISTTYVTFSQDITQTWNPGDTLELWVKCTLAETPAYVQNFGIYYDDSPTVAVAVVNS